MKSIGIRLFVALCCLHLAVLAAVAAEPSKAVFQADFEGKEALKGWGSTGGPSANLTPGFQSPQSLRIERAEKEGNGSRTLRIALPVEKLRGTRVRVEAMVKADGVAKPPQAWNGVKCMLNVVSPDDTLWLQQNNLFGTFDWKPVRFLAAVPQNASQAWLVLGLEQTTGQAWFDDVKITVIGARRRAAAQPLAGPVYRGHDLPRLRGVMIGTKVDEPDLRYLADAWKANHVRWQLIWGGFPRSPADKGDQKAYDEWLESELKRLDRLLPVCREVGIQVLIDLHTPPGGRNDASECQMFHEARFQDAFVKVWEKISTRYKGNETVWGYDLVNEPVEGMVADGLLDWRALATKTAKRVREIDPDHAIVIEPAPWGSPSSLEYFEPIPVDKVVYSVHMYLPHQFTHQGVHGNPVGISYPGKVDGRMWDKDQLRRALQPVVDFQRDYGMHIYIGEFSAIRWAPGTSAEDYLRDVIQIFEENGWDWAYHAYREWDGWSVEHGSDPKDRKRASTPTARENLLRSSFGKNRKPNA